MNHITLMGNLGKDPEKKTTMNGADYWTFPLACNKRLSKERQEIMWWRVVVWRHGLDGVINCLKKGSAIVVHGEMRPPRTYDGQDGTPQISLEIAVDAIQFPPFGNGKKEEDKENPQGNPQPQQSQQQKQAHTDNEDLSGIFGKDDYQSVP